jgi:hypothetical protein
MKTSMLLILAFFISSHQLSSQNSKSTKILGNTYSLSFNRATDTFKICEHNSETEKKCEEKVIQEDTEFAFIEALRDKLDGTVATYKFKIFSQEKISPSFNEVDYSKVVVGLDPTLLKAAAPTDKIAINLSDKPDDFPEIQIINEGSYNYKLFNKELQAAPSSFEFKTDIVTDSVKFRVEIQKQLVAIKDGLAKLYESIIKKHFTNLLEELYTESIAKDEIYTLLTTQKLASFDTLTEPTNYIFLILLNDKLHLKVYKTTDKPSDATRYGEFDKGISESEFVGGMITQHSEFNDGELNRERLGKIYHMINTKKESKIVANTKKRFDDDLASEIDSQLNAETTYSGQMVLNKKMPLYKFETKLVDPSKEVSNKNIVWKKTLLKKAKTIPKKKLKKQTDVYFKVDSVNVHFFNNRADNITIIGRLDSDKNTKTRVLINRLYSLPLRELNNRSQSNTFTDEDNNTYTYYYDDVLDYLPYNKFNYAVRNGEIKVVANDSVRIKERKIGDYFTGIFFSDFLGLNTNNSNSLIVAEGRIRIPFNYRNIRRNTWLDNITVYASVNLFSGFENGSRKVDLDDSADADETSEANTELFTTDNFNLLKNNNIDAGMLVTPYTFEWKGASTFVHFRYGLRFLRTSVEYNLRSQDTASGPVNNELKGFQVFSIGQEAEINFEIRPQSSVGADVTIGVNWFTANGTNKNDVDFLTTNNAPNLKVMANIYSLTSSNDSNAGVYFRIGGHYNLGSYEVFPQVMVGYATNLSSFVNKVAKEQNR